VIRISTKIGLLLMGQSSPQKIHKNLSTASAPKI